MEGNAVITETDMLQTMQQDALLLAGKAIDHYDATESTETDMLQTMQQDALLLSGKALDHYDATESTEIAQFINKYFDRIYGPGWQCIVGADFGSFVTLLWLFHILLQHRQS